MPREHPWYGALLKAAQQRGISLPPVEAENLSEAQVLSITNWIHDNLASSEPLTHEELIIWQKIENKTGRPRHVESYDKPVMPLAEENSLKEKIQSLDASTRDLETRLAILQHQKNGLASLNSERGSHRQSQYHTSSSATLHEAEKQQLYFLNEETKTHMQSSINESQQRVAKIAKAVAPSVRDKLVEDDRVLDTLNQIISSKMHTSSTWESSAESLLAALRTATSLYIKVHLDQVFCSSIENRNLSTRIIEGTIGLEQIYDDLNTLYPEIEAITSMMVDTQHGTRLRAAENVLRNATQHCTTQTALQVLTGLEALTQSETHLASQFQHLYAHKMTLHVVEDFCRSCKNREELFGLFNGQKLTKAPDQRVEALLRHLNTQRPGQVGAEFGLKQGSDTWPYNQVVLDHLVADVRESREVGESRLQQLFATSETQLIEAGRHNEILDQRIASAKSRLETAANTPDITFDIRQQSNGNMKRT